jgi:hypothetical protein
MGIQRFAGNNQIYNTLASVINKISSDCDRFSPRRANDFFTHPVGLFTSVAHESATFLARNAPLGIAHRFAEMRGLLNY